MKDENEKDVVSDCIINKLDEENENSNDIHLNQLKRIVPGDIFLKDSGDVNTIQDNHIAIVASIPNNIEDYSDATLLMDDIILIEGEFSYKIQSVIKIISLGDYNRGAIKKTKTVYGNVNLQGISLNTKSFSIRRLKCKN